MRTRFAKKKRSSKKNGLEESAHAAFSGKAHCISEGDYRQHFGLSSPLVASGKPAPVPLPRRLATWLHDRITG